MAKRNKAEEAGAEVLEMERKAALPKEKSTPKKEPAKPTLVSLTPALSGAIPEYRNVWFDGKRAFASNGRLGIEIPYKSTFKFGVPGNALITMIKSYGSKVELRDEEDALLVIHGRSRVELPLTDLSFGMKLWKFPTSEPKGVRLEMDAAFFAALKRTAAVRLRGKERSLRHEGVILWPSKDGLDMYSTDNATLVEAMVSAKVPKGLTKTILPYGLVDVILAECKPGDELVVGDQVLVVYGAGITVSHAAVDAEELQDITEPIKRLTKDLKTTAALPEDLPAMLERAKVLSGKSESVVNFTTDGKDLTITGKLTYGNLKEIVPCKLPAVGIKLEADRLSKLLGDLDEFAIAGKAAIVLYGKNTMVLLAAHSGN